MEQHQDGVVVVMVPLPAQGHLNPLLHLTRIISTREIPVHFIGSATHNRQAKDRVHGWDPSTVSNVHFHDFQLPQFTTPPPDPNDSNKFPTHLVPIFKASQHLREPLGLLLRSLSSTNGRVVVVHDVGMGFAAEEASFVSNAEAYCFNVMSVFAMLHYIWEVHGEPADEEGGLLPKDAPRISVKDAVEMENSRLVVLSSQGIKFSAGSIYNTCDEIEGRFIQMIANQQLGKKIWALGPFNPVSFDSIKGPSHNCLEWLDSQPPRSVIYVSFGSVTSVNDDQFAQLAIGLERSEQRFIWALRDADRGDIYNEEARQCLLPKGFEERVKGVGMIVRDWAPQLQILAHSSIGGFMSHCGWNSTVESLSMGVPLAAWPMHSDQPKNALLVTEVLKVGLLVREWARREELTSSDTIESVIRKLMVSEEGNAMRKRVNELGINVRHSVSNGGTSTAQLESFLTHISR